MCCAASADIGNLTALDGPIVIDVATVGRNITIRGKLGLAFMVTVSLPVVMARELLVFLWLIDGAGLDGSRFITSGMELSSKYCGHAR
jgi:hypothetical protein